MTKITEVTDLLRRLAQYCDTGFALAVHIRYTRPSFLFQTYSQDWIDFYSENGLMLVDPVVRWGLRNTGMIAWDTITDADEAKVLEHAREFGLENGISLAIGPGNSRTIAGLTRSGAPFSESDIQEMTEIVTAIHDATEGLDGFDESELNALRTLELSDL
jgi:LuxR family transcriptional regulator